MKNIILLSELFVPPYDEGMKAAALNLLKGVKYYVDCIGLGPCSDKNGLVKAVSINKLLYSRSLRKELNRYKPSCIFYIPEASATVNSFIRNRILHFISNGANIAMIALQNREYSLLEKKIIKRINVGKLFIPSIYMSKELENIGIVTNILPLGVDTDKFIPVSIEKKKELREKYDINQENYIILHVGHLRESRNVKIFLDLTKQQGIQLLLVGSTSTPQENVLKEELRKAGIIIIDRFISEINELYQLADCYVFPVIRKDAAIEFPLSVLEAMACNLPILTTPFGSLPEHFPPAEDFRYFTTTKELKIELLRIQGIVAKTRERVKSFSWVNIAKQLLEKCELL